MSKKLKDNFLFRAWKYAADYYREEAEYWKEQALQERQSKGHWQKVTLGVVTIAAATICGVFGAIVGFCLFS